VLPDTAGAAPSYGPGITLDQAKAMAGAEAGAKKNKLAGGDHHSRFRR
jgi:hypothetical protein